MPLRPFARNVNHLLTLTSPTREQVLTTLARILLRNACKSSEGALSVHRWDHQTADCAELHYHEPERINHAVPLLEPAA